MTPSQLYGNNKWAGMQTSLGLWAAYNNASGVSIRRIIGEYNPNNETGLFGGGETPIQVRREREQIERRFIVDDLMKKLHHFPGSIRILTSVRPDDSYRRNVFRNTRVLEKALELKKQAATLATYL